MRAHLIHSLPFVGALLLATNMAQAAIAFDYTVPLPTVPSVNPPVTRVVVLLDVTADPTGATIAVNNFGGGTSGNSPPVNVPVTATPGLPTSLGVNDDARAYRNGTANQVVIEVNAKSWLVDPTNHCNMNPGATAKKFSFTSALTINTANNGGYRMTSYSSAADLNSPTTLLQCSCTGARVKSYKAVFGIPPGGVDKGRLPYDVFLVLDRSGSMNDPAPGDAIEKWTLVQQAVGEYIEAWKAEAVPDTDLSADRLGLIFFSSTSAPTSFGGTLLVPRGPAGVSPHPWDQIKDAVTAQNAFGATALGGGLKDAINNLTQNKPGDRVVLLLTDGMQNVDPKVTPEVGVGTTKFLDLGPPVGQQPLHSQCVRIYSIGIGSSLETVAGELLDAIGKQCAGTSVQVTGNAITSAFINALVDQLTGNTLTLLTRVTGTLPVGSQRSNKIPVTVDGSARRLITVIDWPPEAKNRASLDLGFAAATNNDPAPLINPESRVATPNYVVQRFAVPAPGDYFFRVSRNTTSPASNLAVPYQVSIYAIEDKLDFRATVSPARHGTGQTLKLTMLVSMGGVGVKNIASGFKIQVQRPGDGIGNQLHGAPFKAAAASGSPPNPDAPSPYRQKLAAMAKDPGFQKAVAQRADPNPITVKDLGGGNYIAELHGTRNTVPGKYHFDLTLEFKNPQNRQVVRRTKSLEAVIEVTPDPVRSEISVVRTGNDYAITIVPRDRFGNYKGPGYASAVKVTVTGGGQVGPAVDLEQKGIYVVQLTNVPANTDPMVTISVSGVQLVKKQLSKLEKRSR